MTSLRSLRLATKASQAVFAARLGVSVDAYRPWDAGRREPPAEILAKAHTLANVGPDDRPIALPLLAELLGVSVFRLREAARDGRLAVTYGTRTAFGRAIPRATRLAESSTSGATTARDRVGFRARGRRSHFHQFQVISIVGLEHCGDLCHCHRLSLPHWSVQRAKPWSTNVSREREFRRPCSGLASSRLATGLEFRRDCLAMPAACS
jgi:transcriptional regulator with XRE-family HTH domain